MSLSLPPGCATLRAPCACPFAFAVCSLGCFGAADDGASPELAWACRRLPMPQTDAQPLRLTKCTQSVARSRNPKRARLSLPRPKHSSRRCPFREAAV
eukprot:959853-Pyramimonas_sp.AAC.1